MDDESTYEFDRECWCKQFPTSRLLAHWDEYQIPVRVGNITSPVDLVAALRLREQDERFSNPAEAVPCDVFVFAFGEPADREVTKIGGLPYRPADVPWPEQDGRAYTFIGQMNFTKSRDIVGDTEGDVLLVFASDKEFGDLEFEWYDRGLENLMGHKDIPAQSFECVTCFGVRYRTFDLPPLDHERIGVLEATKIGGVPVYEAMSGYPGDNDFETITDINMVAPGRYLCTFNSVQANPKFEFPWTNHEPQLELEDHRAPDYYNSPRNSLIFYDLGRIILLELESRPEPNWWITSN